ncbi:MAG: hypothetical protein FJ119_00760 [Deltaproteobacteria bacterium]|nr:hypothetical protein [Deltaproteobacteria bacterium]
MKKMYSLLIIAFIIAWLPPAAQAEFREEGIAIIGEKGPNALRFEANGFSAFRDRYMLVSGLTRIYNEAGEPISLAELKVPCEARILYRKRASDGASEAISINIESYIEGRETETVWSLPEIEPLPPQ